MPTMLDDNSTIPENNTSTSTDTENQNPTTFISTSAAILKDTN